MDVPRLFAEDVVDRALERLEFWRSEQIAPFVRSCRISPRPGGTIICDNPYELLDALFIGMSSFTRLKHVYGLRVDFNLTTIIGLANALLLTHLHIEDCNLGDPEAGIDTELDLKVSSFVLTTGGLLARCSTKNSG